MIFVTGATGLIGSFIIRELLHQGYRVKALKRFDSDLSLLQDINSQITFCEGDILDISSIQKALVDVEYVIHSAGFISFNPSDEDKLFKINVEGTANLVNASLNSSIKKLIHISSVAALGKSKKQGNTAMDETHKWEDGDVSNYAKSKYLGELEVWRGSSEGLKVGILNPSVVIGPGNWNSGSTSLFKYIWNKKPFYTNGNINYVDVRNVAQAAVKLLKENIQNERFILNSGTCTYQNIFNTIADCLQKPAPKFKLSKNLIRVFSFFERFRSLITNSKPLITNETASSAFSQTIYINKKAKENLNLTFNELNDTLEWTCRELAKKYNLQIKN